MSAPILTMSNGVEIPALGLGTWQIDDATAERVVRPFVEMLTYQGRDYLDENLAVWYATGETYEQGQARAIGGTNADLGIMGMGLTLVGLATRLALPVCAWTYREER